MNTQQDIETLDKKRSDGPDPIVGVGLVIVGILIMGISGAATAHYLFNFGSLIAMVGAVLFVTFVALSTYRKKKAS
ncbi:MAG: hypothetical protein U0414_17190 [Polyangiaceae bacterium]